MKRTIGLLLITTLAANAQSAEVWILQREAAEATRYAQEKHAQAKVMIALDKEARRVKDKAERAYKAALKREAEMALLVRAEQNVADKQVGIAEYRATDYIVDNSTKDVAAKLRGEYK